MAHRELRVESSTKSSAENQLLWFAFDNDDLILHYQPMIAGYFSEISYLDVDGMNHTVPLSNFTLQNEMCGTYLVVSSPLLFDIDSDGVEEEITVCAKADTNEMQGYSDYSNEFGDLLSVPLEIVKTDRTELRLLQNGEVYTGEITLCTDQGVKCMEITDGIIDFVDARELWNGIVVSVRDGKIVTVGTYVPEEHTIFTMQYLEACVPFVVLLAWIVLGIIGTCVVRAKFQKFGR